MAEAVVLAFGGNAITQAGEKGTFEEQKRNLRRVCGSIIDLYRDGKAPVITHGNGPQVGNLLIKNELAKEVVPAMPLDVCVSNTQGSIGYAIQNILLNEMERQNISIPVVSLITQIVVSREDPAFNKYTKPVGPFYSEAEALKLMQTRKYQMVEDSGRGWRRVVPSPVPQSLVEKEAVKKLMEAGVVVVAAGGGGIPIALQPEVGYQGVEAVIDKDLAAQLLANEIGAKTLVLLTGVERVAINFGTTRQKELAHLTIAEAEKYLAEGQFPAGSMGPKVEAAIKFLKKGGERAIICALQSLRAAIAGETGTEICR